MSCVLEHVDACLPVTAIRVIDVPTGRLILEGHGPYLHLVDEPSGVLLDRAKVFERNAIHGIQSAEVNPTSIAAADVSFLIWGGQSFRLINVQILGNGSASLSFLSCESAAPDWILDASFCVQGSNDQIPSKVHRACLITAHNVLFGFEFGDCPRANLANLQLHQIGTGLKSVLYSADVAWVSPSQILVAAGTVFGEIVVWSCFVSTKSGPSSFEGSSVSIHHLFTGHEGSIFGVDISPEIRWPGEDRAQRFLASCSDDRTIRIWDISDCSSSKENGKLDNLSTKTTTRSTGFGDIFRDDLNMDTEACVAKTWGHSSRIWGAYFIQSSISDQVAAFKLVSRGEDATCQLWDLTIFNNSSINSSPVSSQTCTLKHVSTHAYHTGKNIWSMAIHTTSESAAIYSGGADGSIITFNVDLNHSPGNRGARTDIYDIYDLSPCRLDPSGQPIDPPTRKAKSGDRLNRYAFVSNTSVLALSSHGKLHVAQISVPESANSAQNDKEDDPLITWETIASLDSPGSQFSLTGQAELGVAIIGDVKGTLWWYNHDSKDIITLMQQEKKVTGVFFAGSPVDMDEGTQPSTSIAFVTTSVEVVGTYLFLVKDKSSPEEFTKIQLELPASFPTTSALYVEHKSRLIIGSKTGHLAVFDLRRNIDSHPLAPILTVFNVHDKDSITSITRLRQPSSNDEQILTTGRNGCYCIHTITTADDLTSPPTFQTIHKLALHFGPYIEGAYFEKATKDLIIFGFRGTEFIVWNESTQTERAAIECGGAHRIWAYNCSHSDPNHENFVWTKASAFHLFTKTILSHRSVRIGGHGREIKATAISERPFNIGGEKHKLLATGAEDTMIRISILDETNNAKTSGTFDCLRILKKHNAGIQHLQWSPCGNILFSSAGAEEFYAWRLRSIPGFGVGTVCEGECPKGESDSDLRIMSFDVIKLVSDEEADDSFLLCMAYSNSTVKLLTYASASPYGTFRVIAKGQYTTNCPTQINFCESSSGLSLITASTDGHIATWDISEALDGIFAITDDGLKLHGAIPTEPRIITWQNKHCIHQSSVKAMEMTLLSQDEQLIVSGGDDNAISISRLKIGSGLDSSPDVNSFSTVSLPEAHASAITAVSIVDECTWGLETKGTVSSFLIASSGNDQRLKLWSVDVDSTRPGEDGIGISQLQDAYTAVADISSIGTFTRPADVKNGENGRFQNRIVLGGVGVDLWSLNRV
ncbi:hypothetical protein FQN52_009262 [Onygenales sp. PD_12]|nr:hypothetical protein FQN52_009262 [Onygenales sp. PD_12]